jgi:hypothetical protein
LSGTASNTTVDSGGTLELLGGAQLSGTTTINAGGILEMARATRSATTP